MRGMMSGALIIVCAAALPARPADAQVLKLAELNTRQVQALDRARTVVIMPGGILEEHGPFLPSYTDGYINERIADELAQTVGKRPGWTALMFPTIPLGSGGANDIGGKYVFPGTFAVRPETVRAVYMDLAAALGEQGFRWIFIINSHGDPRQGAALEAAGDYFRDTYGGHMVHLLGFIIGTRAAEGILPKAVQAEDGFTVHAGVEEHSNIMAIRPDLVATDVAGAPSITGKDFIDLRRIAAQDGWPGYFGAPRLASASLGQQLLAAEVGTRIDIAMKILDGTDDERSHERYSSFIYKLPGVAEETAAASSHDEVVNERQREWLAAHGRKP